MGLDELNSGDDNECTISNQEVIAYSNNAWKEISIFFGTPYRKSDFTKKDAQRAN